MSRKHLSAVVGLTILLTAGAANAVVITFDSVPSNGNTFVEETPISTQGFLFGSAHYHLVDDPSISGLADNGSAVYIAEEGPKSDGTEFGLDITMSMASGGAFTLNGFSGAELFIDPLEPFSNADVIMVSGVLAGGGTVSNFFLLDGIIDGIGGQPDFQSFLLDATFTDLISVTFSGLSNTAPGGGLALDNFDVTTGVPEPATLAILGLGLVGLGFMRRRRAS